MATRYLAKQFAIDWVDTNRQRLSDFDLEIWRYAEPAWREYKSTRAYCDLLRQEGFEVEEGSGGMPTAFMASWGSGKPVIALGSDIDCIPQASQKPGVAYHDPMIEGAPGHGEGHNSGVPLNITAALAIKRLMERTRLSGSASAVRRASTARPSRSTSNRSEIAKISSSRCET